METRNRMSWRLVCVHACPPSLILAIWLLYVSVTLEEDCNQTCTKDCSDGWEQFLGKRYKLIKDNKTWGNAEKLSRF